VFQAGTLKAISPRKVARKLKLSPPLSRGEGGIGTPLIKGRVNS